MLQSGVWLPWQLAPEEEARPGGRFKGAPLYNALLGNWLQLFLILTSNLFLTSLLLYPLAYVPTTVFNVELEVESMSNPHQKMISICVQLNFSSNLQKQNLKWANPRKQRCKIHHYIYQICAEGADFRPGFRYGFSVFEKPLYNHTLGLSTWYLLSNARLWPLAMLPAMLLPSPLV